jgi:hypothetical protein
MGTSKSMILVPLFYLKFPLWRNAAVVGAEMPQPAARMEQAMKHFMIKYRFANGTTQDWHREIARFIAALDSDPELKGRISYRCMKNRDDQNYFHLAAATDEAAVKTLQSRDFFKAYTEKTRQVAGGDVTVTPIELIATTPTF